MTFQIRTADGRILTVHTEVGNGVARVCLDETAQAEPPRSIEPEGDDHEFA